MSGRVIECFALAAFLTTACSDASEQQSAQVPPAEEQSGRESVQPETGGTAENGRRTDAGSRLRGDASSLSGAVSALGARVTETEIIVDLPSDVLFDFDRAKVRPQAEPKLRLLAELIRDNPEGLISISGHTDALGDEAYNRTLSERRAEAVANWLIESGEVDAERLRTAGFGETRPAAPNERPDGTDDAEGRRQNRRVEIILPRN